MHVTSGLLDVVESSDELAVALAHELDHILAEDGANKMSEMHRAVQTRARIRLAFSIASLAASVAIPLAAAPTAAAPAVGAAASSHIIWTQAATSAAMQGLYATGALTGELAYSAIVEGYSAKSELRADENALRFAHAAGYDATSALALYDRLDQSEQILKQQNKDIATFHLVGAKPGLKKRIQAMQATLRKMGLLDRQQAVRHNSTPPPRE